MKRMRSPLDAYTLSVRGLLPPVGGQGMRSRGIADGEVRRVPASGFRRGVYRERLVDSAKTAIRPEHALDGDRIGAESIS